jgi:hypothetical protein
MQSLERFWRSWPKLKNGLILNRFAFVVAGGGSPFGQCGLIMMQKECH